MVHIHRQKLEEMVARFEAESPEIGTGETFLHKVQITTGTDRVVFTVATLEYPEIMFHVLSSSVQACQAGNAAAAAALIALAPETGLMHTAHTPVYNPFCHDESLLDGQGNLSVTRAACYPWP